MIRSILSGNHRHHASPNRLSHPLPDAWCRRRCINSPSMCMKSNLATFRCRYCSCSSRMAVRIMADSLAMTARSSAAVLHARTCRMRSRSLRDMVAIYRLD